MNLSIGDAAAADDDDDDDAPISFEMEHMEPPQLQAMPGTHTYIYMYVCNVM